MNSVEKRLFNLVEMKIYEVRLPTYNLCKSYSVLIKSRKIVIIRAFKKEKMILRDLKSKNRTQLRPGQIR